MYSIAEKAEQTDNGWVFDIGLYWVDENGAQTKLCEVENVVSREWQDDCDYIFNENHTLSNGSVTRLYVDMDGRLTIRITTAEFQKLNISMNCFP